MKQDPEDRTARHPQMGWVDHCREFVERLYVEAKADSWGLSREAFAAALQRSAEKHFSGASVSRNDLEDYLGRLHAADLALACACGNGHEEAWEHFVSTYRDYLRRAAAAILRSGGLAAASDLADSLFAELYGLSAGQRTERSLFRYFHGRSSLKTWLRAVLAQRHIDAVRAGRRFTELEDREQEPMRAARHGSAAPHQVPLDPHRERYVMLFTRTLQLALGLLDPRDQDRLRLYYVEELTLAEIGRRFGEHESSVSRNLERTRRQLRLEVEQALRTGRVAANGLGAEPGLSEEEIAQCFEYGAEEAPIDLDTLFARPDKQTAKTERKEP